jgi:hypothetical protein
LKGVLEHCQDVSVIKKMGIIKDIIGVGLLNEDIVGFIVKVMMLTKQLEKFAPESFSSIVLYGEIDVQPGENRHVFRTKSSGNDTCKTPIDMFEEEFIDNDLTIVNKAIKDYY